MKYICLFCFILLKSIASSQTYNLEIIVSDIKTMEGEIAIGVFNNESSFLKVNEELKTAKVKINNHTEKHIFTSLPKGKYAISLYHDENKNNKCDLNFIGIPKEGFGFSNNYVPFISSPSFKDSEFYLQKDTSLTIKLIY